MSGYRRGSHTIYEIKYHLVWVTKYRYHVLRGEVAHRARELIRRTCLALDVRIERGHVGAHPWIESPDRESLRSDEEGKRSVVAQTAAGICSSEKAVLGKALLGTGVFLRDERPGYGGTDSRLHRGTRPGTARSGLHSRGMSFSRLPVVTPS
jgi:hypothetical protein